MAKYKFPNPRYYFRKLKNMNSVYWGIIAVCVILMAIGIGLFANREGKLAEDRKETPTNQEPSEEPAPPGSEEKRAVKIIFKDKSIEATAGVKTEIEVQLIGADNKAFITKEPAYLTFTMEPDTSTKKIVGEGGGSIYIPTGASSTKISLTETKAGEYKLTVGYDALPKDTATLVVAAGGASSISISGPSQYAGSGTVTYTVSGTDQYSNSISTTFSITIVRDGSTTVNTCSGATSCALTDTSAGCHSWKVTATKDSVTKEYSVTKTGCSSTPSN